MKCIQLGYGKKLCRRCSTLRLVSEFSKSSRTKDGLQTTCKPCHKTYSSARWEHVKLKHKDRYSKDPERHKGYQRAYRARHPERVREAARIHAKKKRVEKPEEMHIQDRRSALGKNYGITQETYLEMLKKQGGVCAICARPQSDRMKYLCVDHDHKTGEVRELLCQSCNVSLAHAKEDPLILKSMIAYVNRHSSQSTPQN